MTLRLWFVGGILSAVCVGAAGCGPSTPVDTEAKRYKVTGTVKFADGTPLIGGEVQFMPVSADAGGGKNRFPSEGIVGKTGQYSGGGVGRSDGIAAGEYTVAVVPRFVEVQDNSNNSKKIPDTYRKPETSGMKLVVNDNDNNVFDITLSGPPGKSAGGGGD